MPDRRRRRAGLAIAIALLMGGLGATFAPIALAVPGPGDQCDAEAQPSGQSCPEGIGVFDLGLLLPIAGVVAVGGVVALAVAYLVLRRRAAAPLTPEPVDAADWWTCKNCGRSNVVGSARCYACGSWQR